MENSTIFLLGCTGYIGGSILTSLISHPRPPREIKCLIRSKEKADRLVNLRTRGTIITPVLGSLGERDSGRVISDTVDSCGIVVNAATADEVSWLMPVFEGFKRRKERLEGGGEQAGGIFIHTSGTGMFQDDAMGMYEGDTIYTDLSTPNSPYLPISSIDPTTRHVPLNQYVIEQDEVHELCKTYIVVPCHIWDKAPGEIFEWGLAHPVTIAFPWQIEESLRAGRSIMTGKGLNVWNHVHIRDTASLYTLVLEKALSKTDSEALEHGKEAYYLAVTGDYSTLDIATAIAQEMYKLGLCKDEGITTFDDSDDRYRVRFNGTNARGVPERSRRIGWVPRYGTKQDLLNYIKREVVDMARAGGYLA